MAVRMTVRGRDMKYEGALVAIARRYQALDAPGLSNRLGIGISHLHRVAF
jgi:hypothetical protein